MKYYLTTELKLTDEANARIILDCNENGIVQSCIPNYFDVTGQYYARAIFKIGKTIKQLSEGDKKIVFETL